jgi:hypothetical protein
MDPQSWRRRDFAGPPDAHAVRCSYVLLRGVRRLLEDAAAGAGTRRLRARAGWRGSVLLPHPRQRPGASEDATPQAKEGRCAFRPGDRCPPATHLQQAAAACRRPLHGCAGSVAAAQSPPELKAHGCCTGGHAVARSSAQCACPHLARGAGPGGSHAEGSWRPGRAFIGRNPRQRRAAGCFETRNGRGAPLISSLLAGRQLAGDQQADMAQRPRAGAWTLRPCRRDHAVIRRSSGRGVGCEPTAVAGF